MNFYFKIFDKINNYIMIPNYEKNEMYFLLVFPKKCA